MMAHVESEWALPVASAAIFVVAATMAVRGNVRRVLTLVGVATMSVVVVAIAATLPLLIERILS